MGKIIEERTKKADEIEFMLDQKGTDHVASSDRPN